MYTKETHRGCFLKNDWWRSVTESFHYKLKVFGKLDSVRVNVYHTTALATYRRTYPQLRCAKDFLNSSKWVVKVLVFKNCSLRELWTSPNDKVFPTGSLFPSKVNGAPLEILKYEVRRCCFTHCYPIEMWKKHLALCLTSYFESKAKQASLVCEELCHFG